jgi:hypothetical protein
LAVSISASDGTSIIFLYFLSAVSVVNTSTVSSCALILISFFSIPGISTTTLTSLSVVVTSANGSVSPEIEGLLANPIVVGDLIFPNSLTLGLPSGPTVIE